MKAGHTSQGKWGKAGVPQKGWSCTASDDLGENARTTCEMCV